MEYTYAEYAIEKTLQLLGIDSPTGYTARAAQWVRQAFSDLGFAAKITQKGGVLVDLGGEQSARARFCFRRIPTPWAV